MTRRISSVWPARLFLLAACFALATECSSASADQPGSEDAKPVGRWQDASLEDYRKHLVALKTLTQACAKSRNVQSCDPTLVGPDDRIPLRSGPTVQHRMVRYGWLRILFSHAEEPDKAQEVPGKDPTVKRAKTAQPTTSELLEDAQSRLENDLKQTNEPPVLPADHGRERTVLRRVLEGREFRDLKQPTARDSALERLNNWLNRMFAGMDKLRARSAWVGRALIWGLFLAVATGLAIVLIRMERRWRFRLVPMSDGPAPDAASARDWQMWMADARGAAAAGQWREAIHFLYWAAISRLESKRLWPADRARTAREYLAMVASDDPRRDSLAALTRSFERTWYGGWEAGENEYRAAEALASGLISGAAAAAKAGAEPQPATAEGGTA